MSTMALAGIMVGVIVVFIVVGGLIFVWHKRGQYMKEAQGKIKVVIFPEAGKPYNVVVPLEGAGNEIKVPKGKNLPRYFVDRPNTFRTAYPDNPFFGLTSLQTLIDTAYFFEDNPEPITSQAVKIPHVATGSMIFATIDHNFALVVNELDAELAKTKKQLLEALMNRISKPMVYGGLIVAVLLLVVILIMVGQERGLISSIANTLGVH